MIFSHQERIIMHVPPVVFQNADFDEKVQILIDDGGNFSAIFREIDQVKASHGGAATTSGVPFAFAFHEPVPPQTPMEPRERAVLFVGIGGVHVECLHLLLLRHGNVLLVVIKKRDLQTVRTLQLGCGR